MYKVEIVHIYTFTYNKPNLYGDMFPTWATPNIGWYSKIYQLHLSSMTATFVSRGTSLTQNVWEGGEREEEGLK